MGAAYSFILTGEYLPELSAIFAAVRAAFIMANTGEAVSYRDFEALEGWRFARSGGTGGPQGAKGLLKGLVR